MERGIASKFAYDLMEFIMVKHNQTWWQPPRDYFRLPNVEETFTIEIGELVYLYGLLEYNKRNAEFLQNKALGYCVGDFFDYVERLSTECRFRFGYHSLFMFFARVTAFTVLCYRNKAFDAPFFATTAMWKALEDFDPFILQIGGWPGLAREAAYYLKLPTYILARNVIPWSL